MDRWKGLEAEGCLRRYTFFSANEVAAICGIPLTLQRAWRSRGQLPGGNGKGALFSSLDVAEILIRYQLSLNGVPPSESAVIGSAAAHIVLYWSMLNADGVCEVRGPAQSIHRFLHLFEMKNELAKELAGNAEIYTFIWRGDGGNLEFQFEIDDTINKKRFVSNFFIDLEVAASQLVALAERPLMSVDFEENLSGRMMKRWTHSKA